jgi:hypothetical protein
MVTMTLRGDSILPASREHACDDFATWITFGSRLAALIIEA